MTKALLNRTLFFVSVFGLSSCGVYRQNVVNAPLMQEKGQAQISGSVGFTGFDGQLAYAATKKIALMANYSDLGTKRENFSSVNYSIDKHNFYELGAGYFKKNKSRLISEYFLIAGKGMTSHFVQSLDKANNVKTTLKKVSYNRFCFQADFGKINKKLEYAITPRIMVINYYNITDNSSDPYKQEANTYLYTDIAATLRYNFLKYFKISGQFSSTIPVTGFNSKYYESSPFNCSIGLIINLNFYKPTQSEK